MAFEKEIDEYQRRKQKAEAMGSPKRLAARKAAGILNARERIDYFTDAGSFVETGKFAVSARSEDKDKTPADGVVDGFGKIDGRLVGIASSDFTTLGASSSMIAGKKYSHMRKTTVANGIPMVFFGECSGARMPDFMGAAGIGGLTEGSGYAKRRNIPWASAILGQSYGGSSWHAALSDFVVMRKGATYAVSSARVTSVAINEVVDDEELGGWRMQTGVTGQADLAVDTDEQALDAVKKFLSYLPDNNKERPPVLPVPAGSDDASQTILDILPQMRSQTYDIRKIVRAIVDKDSYFPLKDRFAKAVSTSLCRLDGQSVGIIASNPMFKGGALDPDACDKATAMIALCDSYNIPIILIADTPGFLIGVAGERQKMPGKIMNFLQALELASVPKLALIARKSYGQAYLNFGGGRVDDLAAWFTAEIGFMDPLVGVNVVYDVHHEQEPERFKELAAELARGTSAYDLAEPYLAQDVIDPRDSRRWLIDHLEIHSRKITGGIGEHLMETWPMTIG